MTLEARIEARIEAGDHIIMWAEERTGDDALETWASASCDHELVDSEAGDLVRGRRLRHSQGRRRRHSYDRPRWLC